MEAAPHPWPALGVLLLRDGLVSKEELDEILTDQHDTRQQRISGRRLGEILIQRGRVTPAQVAKLVAEQYELPYVDFDVSDIDLRVASVFSENDARRFSALPISRRTDGSYLLGIGDPGTVLFSEELRTLLGSVPRFVVVGPDAIERAIDYVYSQPVVLEPEGFTDPNADEAVVLDFPSAGTFIRAFEERELEVPTSDTAPLLGALLVRDGFLAAGELEAALAQQRLTPSRRLGEILVERGIVTPAVVARLVAEQYEMRYFDLAALDIDPAVASRLPDEVARRLVAVPIAEHVDGTLDVAISDPTPAACSDELRQALRVPLTIVMASPDAILAVIDGIQAPSFAPVTVETEHALRTNVEDLAAPAESARDTDPAATTDDAVETIAEVEPVAAVEPEEAVDAQPAEPVESVADDVPTAAAPESDLTVIQALGAETEHAVDVEPAREEVERDAFTWAAYDVVAEDDLSDTDADDLVDAYEGLVDEDVTTEPADTPEESVASAPSRWRIVDETETGSEPDRLGAGADELRADDPFEADVEPRPTFELAPTAEAAPTEHDTLEHEETGHDMLEQGEVETAPFPVGWTLETDARTEPAISGMFPFDVEADEDEHERPSTLPLGADDESELPVAEEKPAEPVELVSFAADEEPAWLSRLELVDEVVPSDETDEADAYDDTFFELPFMAVREVRDVEDEPVGVTAEPLAAVDAGSRPGDVAEPVANLVEELTTAVSDLAEASEDRPDAVEPGEPETAPDALPPAIDEALATGATTLHFSPLGPDFAVRARMAGSVADLGTVSRDERDSVLRLLESSGLAHAYVTATSRGEKTTVFVRDRSGSPRTLDDLSADPSVAEAIRSALSRATGAILVCGPPGSGTTTTLYAAVQEVAAPDRIVTTVEHPIERVLEGVDQIEVDPARGATYASVLHEVRFTDPDAVMVGDVFDRETAELALRDAREGRLVLAGLHAPSAAGAIRRLTELGVEPRTIATSLECIVAQRLVRTVCPTCRETYYASEDEFELLGLDDDEGPRLLARGTGCDVCGGTGLLGRAAVFEILLLTDEIRELVADGSSPKKIQRAAVSGGMGTLRDEGVRLCLDGTTSVSELERALGL